MTSRLLVCNTPDNPSEEEFRELVEPYGELWGFYPMVHKHTQEALNRVYVILHPHPGQKRVDLLNILNQIEWKGHLLLFSPVNVGKRKWGKWHSKQPLPEEDQAVVDEVVATLGETERMPLRQITLMVEICGRVFVQRILEEALAIEEAGGMLVTDGSRRRTPGGTFFYVARNHLIGWGERVVLGWNYRKPYDLRDLPEEEVDWLKGRQQAGKPQDFVQDEEAQADAPPESQPEARPEKAESAEASAPAGAPAPKPAAKPKRESLSEQLEALRRKHESAAAELAAVKAGKAKPSEGMFTLMKRVVDTQRQIDDLLRQHPKLG